MNEQEMREKVLKGLKICSSGRWNAPNDRDCTSCPYYPAGYTGCTCKLLMRDALALITDMDITIRALMGEFGDSCDVDSCGGGTDG